MLLLVIEWLRVYYSIKLPAVFGYFSTRMMLAAATALLMTIALGPRLIKKLYEWKIGQPIRSQEECPLLAELHGKKKDTPTMGGVLILLSMIVALFLWMDLTSLFTWLLLGITLGFGMLGAVDDYWKLRYKNSKGVSARVKFAIQCLLSAGIAFYLLCPNAAAWCAAHEVFHPLAIKDTLHHQLHSLTLHEAMARVYLPFFKEPFIYFEGIGMIFAFLLIMIVITGASNAVNLTDGLDGLAAGCLIMVSLVLSLVAFLSNHIDLSRYLNILYIEGSGEIAVYLFAFAGACLGFLWYNGYPAQLFMGDTGSLALGGILGVSAVLLRREVLLALAGAVFVVEAVSVILQVASYRLRNKKRIFLCTPLHHHFEYKGWPETKIVVRFWIISLLFAIISVASLKFQ